MKRSWFVIVSVTVIVIIAVLAPFLASSNPDGLESTAENFETAEESGHYEAPFPDYVVPALGEGGASGIVAMVVGTAMMLLLVIVVLEVLKRRSPLAEESEEDEKAEEEE
jgi:cobalt/nickel transport protein